MNPVCKSKQIDSNTVQIENQNEKNENLKLKENLG